MVCSARNAVSIKSRFCGVWPRSRSACFEALEKFCDFLAEGFRRVHLVHLRTNFAITESN